MTILKTVSEKTLGTLEIYWELVRIIVPVTIATQVLQEIGAVRAVSPYFAPLMTLVGLPPEVALAWLTGLLVGLWGGVVTLFTLLPPSALTGADMTILSVLLLCAHALPIEQRIVQKAGPGFVVTTVLRIGGALVFAVILHQVFAATGWLSAPLQPAWVPMNENGGWTGFFLGLLETLATMLVILLALSWLMELLKLAGILDPLNRSVAPLFRVSGIEGRTVPFASVGLLLGISYGGGLLIAEARNAGLPPRQVFLACVFMGFSHSIIEDTLIVVALGADLTTVLAARMVFAVLATAVIARIVAAMPDDLFFRAFFRRERQGVEPILREAENRGDASGAP
jgi:spore maturation protein SpmB